MFYKSVCRTAHTFMVTTVKKRHTGRHQRSRQREGIFSKSALAKFRNV